MVRIVKAEHLKMKRTFGRKLPWIAPFLMLLLALVLTGGQVNAFPAGAWNWWYILFLPGSLSVGCYLVVKKDKKTKYYNMLLANIAREKSWIGKMIYCSIGMAFANLIMLVGTTAGGSVLGTTVPFWGGIIGALLLTLSYMWEVPLLLFLSARFGMFAGVFTSIILAVSGVVTLADTAYWWVYPASIPIRLMCPTLRILPNGLTVPEGSGLLDTNVILPGLILSIVWFVVFTAVTSFWFARREEK